MSSLKCLWRGKVRFIEWIQEIALGKKYLVLCMKKNKRMIHVCEIVARSFVKRSMAYKPHMSKDRKLQA